MLKKLLELEPKYMATIITSIGGIILAVIIFQAYRNIAEINVNKTSEAVQQMAETMIAQNNLMVQQVKAVEENTNAIKELRMYFQRTGFNK